MVHTGDAHENPGRPSNAERNTWKRLARGLFHVYLALVPALAVVGWITLPETFSKDFLAVVNSVPLVNALVLMATIQGWFAFVVLAGVLIRAPANPWLALALTLDTPAFLLAGAFSAGTLDYSILLVEGLVEIAAAGAAFGVYTLRPNARTPKRKERDGSDAIWFALIGAIGAITIAVALTVAVAKAWNIGAAIVVPIAILWNAVTYSRLFGVLDEDEGTVNKAMRGFFVIVGFGLPALILFGHSIWLGMR
ncbi:MAG: hypothetical protein IT464_09030 [Planctomycetes bacterium]|nr:hypothetical protein [Planctomycetota bacterium]